MPEPKRVLVIVNAEGTPYETIELAYGISEEAVWEFTAICNVIGEYVHIVEGEVVTDAGPLMQLAIEKWREAELAPIELTKLITELRNERAAGHNPCGEVYDLGLLQRDPRIHNRRSARFSCEKPNPSNLPRDLRTIVSATGYAMSESNLKKAMTLYPDGTVPAYQALARVEPFRDWGHFGEPFEIQANDDGPLEDDKAAVIKHREECGCSWPEFDYHAAFHAWWNFDLSPLNSITGSHISEMLVMAEREHFDERFDILMKKLSRILDLSDQIGNSKVIQAAQGSIKLMKEYQQAKKDGLIGPFQFKNAEDDGRLAIETKRETWLTKKVE